MELTNKRNRYSVNKKHKLIFFHSCTVHCLFIYLTNAQLECSKRMLKFRLIFTLKLLIMGCLNNHHQEAYHLCFAKVMIKYYSPLIRKITNLFKQSNIKIALRATNTMYQQLTDKPINVWGQPTSHQWPFQGPTQHPHDGTSSATQPSRTLHLRLHASNAALSRAPTGESH